MQYLTHKAVLEIFASYLDASAHTDAVDDDGNKMIRADHVPVALEYLKNAPDWNQ